MQKNCASDENRTNNSVSHRIQRNQHSHLTRRFSEVMKNYHQVQISFREKCKAQIQRHLEIVGKVMTDDELEDVLPCDNLPIFIPNTNFSSQALTEIERRHQDIISLEYSIKELHEIFTDTAMLLETQGELINSIEKNVTSAGEYAGAAVGETKKAIYYSKNNASNLSDSWRIIFIKFILPESLLFVENHNLFLTRLNNLNVF
ncbi:syntaxin-2-like [Girardinichthys multiradiatus]|uniref:syntaxin-2-like n=1 Tax=Girardinichthys multiradiatus TaxID=208333 RepID=UPI001FAE10A1|nr:syntaxin-2-like [Girardinichthys multiradiatus]